MASKEHGEKTKLEILEKSILLFAEKGFDRVSFQQIANHCNLSQSAVMHHFPNREELLENVIQRVLRRNRQTVDPEINKIVDIELKIRKLLKLNLKWVRKYPQDTQIFTLLYYYASRDPRFSKLYLEIRSFARSRYKNLISEGLSEDLFRAPLGPDLTAEILHDFTLGALVNYLTVKSISIDSISEIEKKWNSLLDTLLIKNDLDNLGKN